MADQNYRIPSTSDRRLIDTFAKIAKVFDLPRFKGRTFADVNFAHNSDSGPDEILKKIIDLNSKVICNATLGTTGITITFSRGEPANSITINSALWDKLLITGDNQGDAAKKVEAVGILLAELRPYEPGRMPTSLDAQTAGELVAIHTSILEKLEHTNADLVAQTTQLQRELRSDAENLIAAERKKVEEWQAEQLKKLDERSSELDNRQRDIDDIKKGVDARSSTFARRQDREKLLDEVKTRVQNFGVSEATETKRAAVRVGMYLLMTVFIFLLGLVAIDIQQTRTDVRGAIEKMMSLATQDESQTTKNASAVLLTQLTDHRDNQTGLGWLWLRFSLLAVGLVGSIIYYIRWQDRWANQHAMAEWELRQFQLDISRANWVIESGLEWKKETGDLMPESMLDRIAHGLFVREGEPAQVLHPADELASALLGSASRLNLKTPMGDVEFNKPSKILKST